MTGYFRRIKSYERFDRRHSACRCTVRVYTVPVVAVYTLDIFHRGGVALDFGTSVVEYVAIDIEFSPYAGFIGIAAVIGIGREDTVYERCFCRCRRTGFIVVVDKIVRATLACISSVGGTPVVEYVVDEIYTFIVGTAGITASAQSGCAACMVCQHVMVECCTFTAPDTSVPVVSLDVDRPAETLAEQTPL